MTYQGLTVVVLLKAAPHLVALVIACRKTSALSSRGYVIVRRFAIFELTSPVSVPKSPGVAAPFRGSGATRRVAHLPRSLLVILGLIGIRSTKSRLTSLGAVDTEVLPQKSWKEEFKTNVLVDALATALGTEWDHELRGGVRSLVYGEASLVLKSRLDGPGCDQSRRHVPQGSRQDLD